MHGLDSKASSGRQSSRAAETTSSSDTTTKMIGERLHLLRSFLCKRMDNEAGAYAAL